MATTVAKLKTAPIKELHVGKAYSWLERAHHCDFHLTTQLAYFEMRTTKRKMCIVCVHEYEQDKANALAKQKAKERAEKREAKKLATAKK